MVSDIGCGAPAGNSVLRAVLDSGVNFIETSESYDNGRNEVLIGNVMKDYDREELFVATKAFTTADVFDSTDEVLQRAEGSLKRLQTRYIDLYMIHQARNTRRVRDDSFHRAAEILRKQGKIRFTGLSCHGPEWGSESSGNLEDILTAAAESGKFDVIMLPYNFLAPGTGERILKACRDRDLGTMIMKSNPILTYDDYSSRIRRGRGLNPSEYGYYEGLLDAMKRAEDFFRKYRMNDTEQMKDGAVQFILSNPDVHTICCRFRTFSDVDKYIRLSGTTLDDRLALILNDFRKNLGSLNCRIGCSACEKACPHGVPVNTIMRYSYYFHARRMEKAAMQYYRDLPGVGAGSCMECEGFCEQACPYGVAARFLLSLAHADLGVYGHGMPA